MTTILLSEDEPLLARNIVRALSGPETEVIHAESAALTRAALGSRSFDIVLADISLGDGDGIDVISQAGLGETPVIVMSGDDSQSNRSRADDIPASAFLSKPFALSELRYLVSVLARNGKEPQPVHRRPSVVMYSHDATGLAGFRRNEAIATALINIVRDVSVLMLVDCPEGTIFNSHPCIDYVRLPSLITTEADATQSDEFHHATEATPKMRIEVLEQAILGTRPDILLVDGQPAGRMGEIEAVLKKRERPSCTRTVLGLSDDLDTASDIRAGWTETGEDRLVNSAYDRVLVYDDNHSDQSTLGLEEMAPGRIFLCGFVPTALSAEPRMPGSPKGVLISVDGAGETHPLIGAAISAIEMLPRHRRPDLAIVTDPPEDIEAHQHLLQRATDAGVIVYADPSCLTELMAEADLFISAGSYGAINEALAIGCPVICLPAITPLASEFASSRMLAAQGLIRLLPPRYEVTPWRLARLMTENFPAPQPSVSDLNGAANAARELAGLLTQSAAITS